jgi:uncharacterized membrane protein YkvA (DUF1232 family)
MERLRAWARNLKAEVLALWLAARDSRTPLGAKLVAGLVAAYALSPIDLIPDFIPVLGLVDDLLLLPVGIWLALRLIPAPLMMEFRSRAQSVLERPASRAGTMIVVALWLVLLVAFVAGFWR